MSYVKFCFYVPESHVEQVKVAVFAQGAGHIGEYTSCSWQVSGKGQFVAGAKTNPFIGDIGQVTVVDEIKVEMICHKSKMRAILDAFFSAHPYEEPAYDIAPVFDLKDI